MSFLSQLLYALKYSGNKSVMLNKNLDPLLRLLFEGISGFIIFCGGLSGLYIPLMTYKRNIVAIFNTLLD